MSTPNNVKYKAEEVALIRRGAKIVDDCFDAVLLKIRAGMTEIQLSDFIKTTLISLGADDISFETIVCFGENGSEPHHVPTDRALKKGDMVTVDMGATVSGFCSDFTRTFAFGTPDAKMVEIYQIVKAAQEIGLKTVGAQVRCFDVDKVCRDYIAEKGFGEYFVHGTGHGVGKLIHEPPTINAKSEEVLRQGEVVTIEPGIYISGVGGVRIEDMVVVGENAPLSRHGRELLAIC